MSQNLKMKNLLIILSLLLWPSITKAVEKQQVYTAYINNNMEQWKSVIDKMESANDRSSESTLELVNYQYGYIGYCLEFEKTDEAKKYFSKFTDNLSKLEKSGFDPALINAYKAALYAFRISLNKFSAPFNGPKSLDYAKKALELDSLNYMANIQYGYALFNMPAAFGGSKKDGIAYFIRAKKILEKKPADLKENWNFMRLLVSIGQSYTEIEDYSSARATYESILKMEPGFRYVKDQLYPSLLKKMND
jgi:hypothetical protein